MDDTSSYLIIFLCLLFSAFFSGMEIAFISTDKLHIEVLKKKESFGRNTLAKFTANPSHFLATMLVGNNIALVLYGIYMAGLLESSIFSLLPEALTTNIVVLITQSIISAALVLLTAEFLPKSLFMINPSFSLKLFAIPMGVICVIMYPVVYLVVKISTLFIWMFGSQLSDGKPVFGLTDLNNYIKNSILNIQGEEASGIDPKILNNAIGFKKIKVRDCMIPRTEIIAVDITDSIEDLKKQFVESGHSKILVYKNSIDEVIGYCPVLDLFKKPTDIKSILTDIHIAQETMLANELLLEFTTERKSLALVVDEYGGTSGLITIEDIVEEIFGEIRDEYDDKFLIEEQLDEHNFIFSARHEIDYLNDQYEIFLPKGEYDTLGGLIFAYHEDIPEVNDVIKIPPFLFTISSMEENKIDKVKVTLIDSKKLG